jgi:hypothetical protein
MSGPQLGHVGVSNTLTVRFFLGSYERLLRLSGMVGHSFHITNTFRYSLELPTSLLHASFKSKHRRRDLRLTLEWPTRSSSQALQRRSLCVRYSWRFVWLDRLGCPGVTKVMVDLEKCVLPSPLWGFDSKNWIRSWWSFGVDYGWKRSDSLWAPQRRRRHPFGWPNFEKKYCVFVSLILIYFLFLFKLCSCLEFDITIDLNSWV